MRQMYYGGKHTDVMWFYPTDQQDQLNESCTDEQTEEQAGSPPPYQVYRPFKTEIQSVGPTIQGS